MQGERKMTPFYMIFKNTLMATGQSVPKEILLIGGGLAVILLVAFLIGLKKGVRRISWTGIVWLVASVAFVLANKGVGDEFRTRAVSLASGLAKDVQPCVGTLLLSIATVVAVLVLYGIVSLFLRPSAKEKRRRVDPYAFSEDEMQYEEDYEEYQERRGYVKQGYQGPNLLGRLLGGVLCVLNVGMVFAVTVAVALLLVNATGLKAYANGLFDNDNVKTVLSYAKQYALDFLFIGILIAFACKGRKKGFLETLRSLLTSIGMVGAIVLGFYLPFKTTVSGVEPEGAESVVFHLVYRCEDAVASMGGTLGELAPILSKIGAGILLVTVFVTVVLLISWALKTANRSIAEVGFLRVIDGSVALVLYLIIGFIVCVAIWALLAVLSYYDVFAVRDLFAKGNTLSNAFFKVCQSYANSFLQAFGI